MGGGPPALAAPRPAGQAGDVERPGTRQVDLGDGRALVVRPMAPGDVDGLVELYAGLSDEDRYRRFFSAYRPDRAFFERAVAVWSRGGAGLVAVEVDTTRPDRPELRIVGEASYELLPSGDGELGMAVAADRRGWLGPYLLDALLEVAASRGVPNLRADVLATNAPMLALLRSRGHAYLPTSDWVSLRLVIGTRGDTPVWSGGPGGGLRRRGRLLVEAPGGRWHGTEEAREAGFDVVTCAGPRAGRRGCPALAGRPCPLVEGADAVVVSRAPDDERWRALVDAHAELHPGVPVCIEPREGPAGPETLTVAILDRVTAALAAAGHPPARDEDGGEREPRRDE